MIDENTIIRRITNGEVDSFRVLAQRYQGPVVAMISNITNDKHLAEDIAQDVFLAAYKKLKTFDPARGKFSTWLFTIARNKSINALKKKKAFLAESLPDKIDPHSPYDDLAEKEFFEELDKKLQNLPKKQKIAFVLAEIEGLPYDQIAQIEGVRLGTVKSRINRAKKKLIAALKANRGDIK